MIFNFLIEFGVDVPYDDERKWGRAADGLYEAVPEEVK